MRNEVNNITTLAFFANEVGTFLQVVEKWNLTVSMRDDMDSLVCISSKEWSDDRSFCYVKIQCNNMAALFQVGQLFSEECRITTLR